MSLIKSYHRPAFRARLLAGVTPAWLSKHKRKNYIVASILSFPGWVNRIELQAIEKQAERMTLHTGIQHHVGHDIPLTHPLVCGLSVPSNLRVVTWKANLAKGNKWSREECVQLYLFPFFPIEQYCLSF